MIARQIPYPYPAVVVETTPPSAQLTYARCGLVVTTETHVMNGILTLTHLYVYRIHPIYGMSTDEDRRKLGEMLDIIGRLAWDEGCVAINVYWNASIPGHKQALTERGFVYDGSLGYVRVLSGS